MKQKMTTDEQRLKEFSIFNIFSFGTFNVALQSIIDRKLASITEKYEIGHANF